MILADYRCVVGDCSGEVGEVGDEEDEGAA